MKFSKIILKYLDHTINYLLNSGLQVLNVSRYRSLMKYQATNIDPIDKWLYYITTRNIFTILYQLPRISEMYLYSL